MKTFNVTITSTDSTQVVASSEEEARSKEGLRVQL